MGSIDPATGDLVTKPGWKKHAGSISEKESLISEENRFKNIVTLECGVSPLNAIEVMDAKYPDRS